MPEKRRIRAPERSVARARRLRRDMSLPEVILWDCLRGRRTKARWRRQHPVGPFVLDFFCAEAKLAVEVDGAGRGHPGQVAHDRRRDAWLAAQGVRVLRVDAMDVLADAALDGVLGTITAIVAERRSW